MFGHIYIYYKRVRTTNTVLYDQLKPPRLRLPLFACFNNIQCAGFQCDCLLSSVSFETLSLCSADHTSIIPATPQVVIVPTVHAFVQHASECTWLQSENGRRVMGARSSVSGSHRTRSASDRSGHPPKACRCLQCGGNECLIANTSAPTVNQSFNLFTSLEICRTESGESCAFMMLLYSSRLLFFFFFKSL